MFKKYVKKQTIALILLSLLAAPVAADVIEGSATLDGSTTNVGLVNSAGDIIYYIPIESGPDETYGFSGGGMSPDTVTLNGSPIDGALLHMYLHFDIPALQVGNTLTINVKDLDLLPYNDPNGFFEAVTFYGQGVGLPGERFVDFADIDALSTASVVNNDPATNNNITMTFTGLNIGPGHFWLHLGFDAYSTFEWGTWKNTKEKIFAATITTTDVPEPASITLMLLGLIGLARRRIRI